MMSNEPDDIKQDKKAASGDRLRRMFFLVWAIIGILLLVVATVYALGTLAAALALIAIAAFIVFVLRIPVAWLERRGVPRALGALIAYLGGIMIVALFLLLFIPIIWGQALGLIEMIPAYMDEATATFNTLYSQYGYLLENNNIQQLVGGATSSLSDWAGDLVSQAGKGALNFGTGLATSVMVLVLSLIVGFWILKDLPKIGHELRIVIGPKHEETVLFITKTVSDSFGGYLRGMTLCAVFTGTISGIGFYLLGLPYPAVLGLLTGLLNFIPYVGPWVSGLIAAIIGLFISTLTALLAVIVVIVAQQLVDNFIYPRVMLAAVKLHPAVVLVGVFAGGAVGGFIGLIAAVPLLASAKIIFVHFFERRTGRVLTTEDGAIFRGTSDDVRLSAQNARIAKLAQMGKKVAQGRGRKSDYKSDRSDKSPKNPRSDGSDKNPMSPKNPRSDRSDKKDKNNAELKDDKVSKDDKNTE